MKDTVQYFRDLDEALETGTSVGEVQDHRRHEAERRDLIPDATGDLDEERAKAEAALAAVEEKEAAMREAIGQWEFLLSTREKLRVRLGNIVAMQAQAAGAAESLLLEAEPQFGNPNGYYDTAQRVSALAGRLDDFKKGAELLERAGGDLAAELDALQKRIEAFAKAHGIEREKYELVSAE